jgi:hypothetical protein
MTEQRTPGAVWRLYLLSGIVVAMLVLVMLRPSIPQESGYHLFADARTMFGIPNALNVLSNLPFVVVGLIGIGRLAGEMGGGAERNRMKLARLLLFSGIVLTGFGSAWYHLAPSNDTLVWDRLPMTIVFMMFFALLVADRIDPDLGRRLAFPLLVAGVGSVLYWYFGESAGHGDLRPYVLVQFAPMLLAPLIVLLYPNGEIRARDFWMIIVLYLVAKLVEVGDEASFELGELVSGHTLKHLFAAAATAAMLPIAGEGSAHTVRTQIHTSDR